MKASYEIPEQNLDELRGRIDKLNRRCAKLGVAPILLKVVSEEIVPCKEVRRCDAVSESLYQLGVTRRGNPL